MNVPKIARVNAAWMEGPAAKAGDNFQAIGILSSVLALPIAASIAMLLR